MNYGTPPVNRVLETVKATALAGLAPTISLRH
jgi:hypothetical protein